MCRYVPSYNRGKANGRSQKGYIIFSLLQKQIKIKYGEII